MQLDVVAVGEQLHRLAEIDVLLLFDVFEHVVSQADCARFGCGYAPRGWDNLVRHLANKGFTQQEMLDAGLARQGQRGVYDYFRGRVTWPIRDSTGRTITTWRLSTICFLARSMP